MRHAQTRPLPISTKQALSNETNDRSTLLQNVVNEGTADFVASLILPEPNVLQSADR